MFSSDKWFGSTPSFYNGVATQSLRFGAVTGSSYMSKTFSGGTSTGSGATCTLSVWVKRNDAPNTGYNQWFFCSGASGSAYLLGFRASNDVLSFTHDTSGVAITTTAQFRDTNAWYHIVLRIKTAESDNNDKYQLYVNGTRQTVTVSGTPVATNVGTNVIHNIGRYPTGSSYANVYLADMNFVDGLALDASYFGELKSGTWIAKEPDVSEYGTNGFRLKFDKTGLGTGSASTIGADSSTKNNHFDSSGIDAEDCNMLDSPENKFCTLNLLARFNRGSNVTGTYSEGNLKLAHGGTGNGTHGYGSMRVNDFLTDGCYFEIRCIEVDASRFYVGIVDPLSASGATIASYGFANKAMITNTNANYSTTGTGGGHATSPSTALSISTNDIVGVAVKGTSIWFHVNGTYSRDGSNNLGNPSSGANAFVTAVTNIATKDYFPYVGYSSSFVLNFGQDPSFAGGLTGADIGTETPDEGAGVFKYPVPTGFKALCTANLPEPTIGPNSSTQAVNHFGILTYTANGNASRSIVSGDTDNGIGGEIDFKPDWLWVKARNNSYYHGLWDSNRTNKSALYSNIYNAEDTSTAGTIGSLDTNGFTTPNVSGGGFINIGSTTYVAWCWKANGGTTTTNDASATGVGSIDSVHQANTKSGFSIVTYTGSASSANNGTASTVAHGLGAVPKWIWFLPRDQYDGCVYHAGVASDPATDRLLLKTSSTGDSALAASDSNEFFNDTEPTSTVFSIGTRKHANSSGGMVAYCFAEVDGFSKFGSYTGNGDADGPFVYTGFQPAWVMLKRTDTSGNWIIYDNTRDPFNDGGSQYLYANLANTEPSDGKVDFVSNGFKQRSPSSYTDDNASGGTYIYMAFAEAPFKYANGR